MTKERDAGDDVEEHRCRYSGSYPMGEYRLRTPKQPCGYTQKTVRLYPK